MADIFIQKMDIISTLFLSLLVRTKKVSTKGDLRILLVLSTLQ